MRKLLSLATFMFIQKTNKQQTNGHIHVRCIDRLASASVQPKNIYLRRSLLLRPAKYSFNVDKALTQQQRKHQMVRRSVALLSGPRLPGGLKFPDLSKHFKWYPVGAGEFLGDMIAGHNAFIQDIPKSFDAAHAKHFALVESAAIVPAFSLSIVHYFSTYCQFPSRGELVPHLQRECNDKSLCIRFWTDKFASKQAMESVPWRIGLLTLQVTTFPFWLLLSSASPAVVHSTLLRINHIMASKYSCVSKNAPPFVSTAVKSAEAAESFHRMHTHCTTDFGAAICVLFLLWYLA